MEDALPRSRVRTMSELFPKTTSDEVDLDAAQEDVRRDSEIERDKPPHHEG